VRFAFTDEQRLFRDAVRDLLEKECTPERLATGDRFADVWKQLADMGVVGLTVSKEDGGLNLDEIDLVLLLEETGRAALPLPVVETTAVVAPLLREAAPRQVRERWLPAIAAGDAVATIAVAANGFAAAADDADLLVVHDGDAIHALSRDDAKTLTVRGSLDPTRRLFTVSWQASPESLVARDGAALEAAFDRGALGVAAQLLGVASRVIELAAAYAKERHQFGKPIGSFQAVKHLLADALIALEFARPAVYRAAFTVARGPLSERSRDVSMAKALASEACTLACRNALQVHGAIGYTHEHPLHLWLRRGWALALAWGDAARHRERVAHAVLD
jgi:alkylation response protein AidB-like acyl-CoA dehydrogenase